MEDTGPASAGESSLSQARTYREMGEYWDTHDVTEFWEQTEPVDFVVALEAEVTWYPPREARYGSLCR